MKMKAGGAEEMWGRGDRRRRSRRSGSIGAGTRFWPSCIAMRQRHPTFSLSLSFNVQQTESIGVSEKIKNLSFFLCLFIGWWYIIPDRIHTHLDRVDPETPALGPGVESGEYDDGLRGDVLRQPEQDAGRLGELGAGEAEGALQGGGDAVELGARGGELVDCGQGVG